MLKMAALLLLQQPADMSSIRLLFVLLLDDGCTLLHLHVLVQRGDLRLPNVLTLFTLHMQMARLAKDEAQCWSQADA